MMNDERIEDFSVIALTEPNLKRTEEGLRTVPTGHTKWTKLLPTQQHEEKDGRWPVYSMMWIRKDIEAEQMKADSANITAAILTLPARKILVVSVYVPGGGDEELENELRPLAILIREAKRKTGVDLDILLMGDFNRHDITWGGLDVTPERQGEGTLIIEFMARYGMRSMLSKGTTTLQLGDRESTVDLVIASDELAATAVRCGIHVTDHGSDHRAIETCFDINDPIKRPNHDYCLKTHHGRQLGKESLLT